MRYCGSHNVISISCYYRLFSPKISAIFSNIGGGIFSSIVTAWIIDKHNTNVRNVEFNKLYFQTYIKLILLMRNYIIEYAKICSILFSNYQIDGFIHNYDTEKHTWLEWYSLIKENFVKCDNAKKQNAIYFLVEKLNDNVSDLLNEIQYLQNHIPVFRSQGVVNEKISNLLMELNTELKYFQLDLHSAYYLKDENDKNNKYNGTPYCDEPNAIWEWLDAINFDLKGYMEQWKDFCFFNELHFSPHSYFEFNTDEVKRAIKLTEKNI
jgi:hypothetical protein